MAPTNSITIDGKEWPVELDTNALIEAEEITGRNILMGSTDSLLRPSFTLLRALLFVVLRAAGAKYSLKEVAAFITVENSAALRDAFVCAWSGVELSAPEAEADEPGAVPE